MTYFLLGTVFGIVMAAVMYLVGRGLREYVTDVTPFPGPPNVLPEGWSSDYPPPAPPQPGGPDWEPPQHQKPKPKTMWDR